MQKTGSHTSPASASAAATNTTSGISSGLHADVISGLPEKLKRVSGNQKKIEKQKEKCAELIAFDLQMQNKWLAKKSSAVLAGTDEVGRGCIAGPVVAAAVIMGSLEESEELATVFSGLNDSKKLSPQTREDLAAVIKARCRYALAESSVEEIEVLNILQASFLAMRRALEQLDLDPESLILVDGNQKIPKTQLKQILVIGGDGISASIAAASIIAKVHRDRLMQDLHKDYPSYGWDSNKGYGSSEHRQALHERGLSPWHRRSFCRKIMQEQLLLLPPSELSSAETLIEKIR